MIRLLVLLSCVTAAAQDPAAGVAVERGVRVAMRDGVELAADVYLPRGDAGRLPVLVARTPYNRQGLRGEAEVYARHGYAVVAQDVRGRFDSGGDFYPFVNEGPDGFDTIEWAARQPWSNGKVGTFGASYLAWAQYRAAMERPPHLAAMFANVGGGEFYQEFAYPGGAMNPGWGLWIVKSAETSAAADRQREAKAALTQILENPGEWFALHPRRRAEVLRPFPAHLRIYEDFLAHPRPDEYWRDPAFFVPGTWRRMKDVPVLFISGWYDYFAEGLLRNFDGLSRLQKSAHRLVMGPWWHAVGGRECGDADFGAEAAADVRALTLDWFDHWLKGKPLALAGNEPVRYFRMGGGSGRVNEKGRREHGGAWRSAPRWPPHTREKPLFLGAGFTLAARAGEAPPVTYEFDPRNPVPTIGGRYGMGNWTPNCFQNQVCRQGALGCRDERPLTERDDVLSFISAPLEEAIEVSGAARVKLWVSTDGPDTDFAVKLIDVAPDGYAAHIADGVLRMRYRKGWDREARAAAGEAAGLEIVLNQVSNLFAKGHRIRLDVTSSNWPQFDPNPNTGEPVNEWTRTRVARNTVYLDRKRPSQLILPVVVGQ